MEFKEIKKILEKYKFFGFTVKVSEHALSYTFHSIPYFAVEIIVHVLKLDKDRIVSKVKIGNIEIEDEKELIPTLNDIYKIHKAILFKGN